MPDYAAYDLIFIDILISTSFPSLQDSQEFLRCFMDDLHEELKQPLPLRSTDNAINEECDSQKRDVHGDNVSTSSDTYSGYVSSDTVVPLTGGSSAITLATADSGLPRVGVHPMTH